MEILNHNREAWNKQVEEGNIWTKPVDSEQIEEAKKGRWSVLLTPTKPVPSDWFPELDRKKVLCLASGGGQQEISKKQKTFRISIWDCMLNEKTG